MRHFASASVVVALVLALAGAGLSARLLTTAGTKAGHDHGVAGSVRSSFGSVRVAEVRTLPGLTSKALAGVTHFPSYVPPTSMQVQVSVVLTNTHARPVRYTPQQFRLWAGPRKVASAAGASTPATTLAPRASLEVGLDFVVPRGGRRLWLEFSDPAQKRARLIDLGRAKERTVKKGDAHVH